MKVVAKTDIGKSREMNQDYYYISNEEDKIKLYILADGMGGYAGGEIASSLAVYSVKNYIHNNYEKLRRQKRKNFKFIKRSYRIC